MIRLKQIEDANAYSRAKKQVRNSFVLFAVMCAAIRMTPYLLRKFC